MADEKKMTEQESLDLITDMIKKAKSSYHDTGIGPLLWGSVVAIASFMTFLQNAYGFYIGFDIWLIVLAAFIPQIIISIREKKLSQVKKYEDDALNTVWMVFGLSIFGLNIYQLIVPDATQGIIQQEGWQMTKHYLNSNKPDEVLRPFPPSLYSLYILLYAFPTLVTGLVKKFKPMTYGAIIAYALFIWSCYTPYDYDWLLGGVTAIICWLIPGIILRRRYLAQQRNHV